MSNCARRPLVQRSIMRFVRATAIASALTVGPTHAQSPPPDRVPADTIVTLQRGGCEKRCAVYKLVLFADGTVIYDGQYYVRRAGVVVDKVSVDVIAALVEEFRT